MDSGNVEDGAGIEVRPLVQPLQVYLRQTDEDVDTLSSSSSSSSRPRLRPQYPHSLRTVRSVRRLAIGRERIGIGGHELVRWTEFINEHRLRLNSRPVSNTSIIIIIIISLIQELKKRNFENEQAIKLISPCILSQMS